MRILFFADSLQTGGKERRLLELIQYLTQQTGYEIALVLTEDEIHYKYVYELIGLGRISVRAKQTK